MYARCSYLQICTFFIEMLRIFVNCLLFWTLIRRFARCLLFTDSAQKLLVDIDIEKIWELYRKILRNCLVFTRSAHVKIFERCLQFVFMFRAVKNIWALLTVCFHVLRSAKASENFIHVKVRFLSSFYYQYIINWLVFASAYVGSSSFFSKLVYVCLLCCFFSTEAVLIDEGPLSKRKDVLPWVVSGIELKYLVIYIDVSACFYFCSAI